MRERWYYTPNDRQEHFRAPPRTWSQRNNGLPEKAVYHKELAKLMADTCERYDETWKPAETREGWLGRAKNNNGYL